MSMTPPPGWSTASTAPPPGWDSAAPPPSGGALSEDQLADLWVKAGGPPGKIARAMAKVASVESSGLPGNVNKKSGATGLWQILPAAHGPGNWTDPLVNARKAVALFMERGFQPWEDSRPMWEPYVRSLMSPIAGTASAADGRPPGWDEATVLHSPPPGWNDVNTAPREAFRDPRGFAAALHPPKPPGPQVQSPPNPFERAEKAIVDYTHAPGAKKGRTLVRDVPELKPAAKILQKAQEQWDWAKQHPGEAFGDVMGAGFRAVASQVRESQRETRAGAQGLSGYDWGHRWKALGDAVMHPSVQHNHELTDSLAVAAGMAKSTDIDRWVNKHTGTGVGQIDPQWAPYFKMLLGGGSEFLLQTSADPTNLIPGKKVAQGASGLLTMLHVLHGVDPAVAKMFAPLAKAQIGAALENVLTPVQIAFTARPQLFSKFGGVFTPHGASLRMQIEQAEASRASKYAAADAAAFPKAAPKGMLDRMNAAVATAAKPLTDARDRAAQFMHGTGPKVVETPEDRFKLYIALHGSAKAKQRLLKLDPSMAAKIPAGHVAPDTLHMGTNVAAALKEFATKSPEEQKELLALARKNIEENETARNTMLVAQHSGMPVIDPATKIDPFDTTTKWKRMGDAVMASDAQRAMLRRYGEAKTGGLLGTVTAPFRELGKLAVFLNPLPHGMQNVGTLAYWGGGLPVLAKGISGMLKPPTDDVVARLASMGSYPRYTQMGGRVWDKLPVYAQTMHRMTEMMQGMELSWRAAMLSELDRTLGPSKNLTEELMKGATINAKLGNYEAQSAFVKMFEAIGGPFVVFRLGIVPKAMMQTLYEHPGRYAASARVQESLQENRSVEDQKKNVLTLGGAQGDSEKLVVDLPGFLESPATLGIFGSMIQQAKYDQNRGPVTRMLDTFGRYSPTNEPWSIGMELGTGGNMPGKKHETLADRLMTSTLMTLGGYYSKLPTAKQRRQQHAKYRQNPF